MLTRHMLIAAVLTSCFLAFAPTGATGQVDRMFDSGLMTDYWKHAEELVELARSDKMNLALAEAEKWQKVNVSVANTFKNVPKWLDDADLDNLLNKAKKVLYLMDDAQKKEMNLVTKMKKNDSTASSISSDIRAFDDAREKFYNEMLVFYEDLKDDGPRIYNEYQAMKLICESCFR